MCTQLLARLCKYEPVVEVVENAHSPFSQGGKGRLRNFGEDARRQGQPEGQDLVLICPTLERELQKWPVFAEGSRHESTRPSGRTLQTNLGYGRTRKCFLRQHLERQLVKCVIQNSQIQDQTLPTTFLGHNEVRDEQPDPMSAGGTGSIASFASRTTISACKTGASTALTEVSRMPLNLGELRVN